MDEDDPFDIENLRRLELGTDLLEKILIAQKSKTPPGNYAIIAIPMHVSGYVLPAIYCNDQNKAHQIAQELSRRCGELTPDRKDVARPNFFNFRRTAVYNSSGEQVALFTSGERYERRN